MALKDLYLHILSDYHSIQGEISNTEKGLHPDTVEAHNRLVEEVLKLRKRVNELERDKREIVKG